MAGAELSGATSAQSRDRTPAFGSGYAIDFVPVADSGRSAPISWRSLLRPERPDVFPGFGRPILAPAVGVVVAVQQEQPDHLAYRGLPSVGYALTQPRRVAKGWPTLAGNHLLLETPDGLFVALCHLQRGSVRVKGGRPGRGG